jgi:molecular chaperone DnaK (HSP70)
MADCFSIVIGIELGDDYARVGTIVGDTLNLFLDDKGHSAIPAYVAFTDQGTLVGHAAKEQASGNPNNTIYDIR